MMSKHDIDDQNNLNHTNSPLEDIESSKFMKHFFFLSKEISMRLFISTSSCNWNNVISLAATKRLNTTIFLTQRWSLHHEVNVIFLCHQGSSHSNPSHTRSEIPTKMGAS